MFRIILTVTILCGILIGTASASTRYVPRTIIHNGQIATIWVKQKYQKVTVYRFPAPWEKNRRMEVYENHGNRAYHPYYYRIR